jgi:hypothetical protein
MDIGGTKDFEFNIEGPEVSGRASPLGGGKESIFKV